VTGTDPLSRHLARLLATGAIVAGGVIGAMMAAGGAFGATLAPPPDLVFANGFEPAPPRQLTVTNVGGGSVVSVPAGIDCGATCNAAFPDGASVTLQARTTNGSDLSFTGWSGDCTGSFRDCALALTADRTAGATFTAQPWNLAFVSSATFATNLGSAAAYDAQCNALASAAGINNAIGDAYVAWISGFGSNALARLGSARGFVRLDGVPFADLFAAPAPANQIFNPIERDELGATARSLTMLTGTQASGSLAAGSCVGWSASSGVYNAGTNSGGPVAWTNIGLGPCGIAGHVYCLMKTKSAALSPPAATGRSIWISSAAYAPGSASTPDQFCDADRPAGVASARAVLATATTPASDALSPAALYVRPDGQVVGTGAELSAATLRSGIWQTGGGAYLNSPAIAVWTGDAADLAANGTAGGTCTGWSTNAGNGATGLPSLGDARFWNSGTRACSDLTTRLICAEQ